MLILGSVLSVGGYLVYQQRQDIDALTSQVIVLMNKSTDIQKQTSAIDKRLNATIKTSNHNFKELEQDDDTLTSNNTNFVGTVSAANVVSNTQLEQ